MICEVFENKHRLVRDSVHSKADMACIATQAIIDFLKIFKVDGMDVCTLI